ncbi:MAG: hypothetical protein LIO49_03130 [Ruminococcus sp.]|nr:hypothetical protein [Ruminococcus sp.]
MRIVTISEELLDVYYEDEQVLRKHTRPCVLIVRLKYKGEYHTFAVPLRSNIPSFVPKSQFFALPPRKTTKLGHRHGIHYIKMFPIDEKYTYKFNMGSGKYQTAVINLIDNNESRIVSECQSYLTAYESGLRPNYCTDIDLLLERLKEFQESKELTTV